MISKPQYGQNTEISPLCPCALKSVPLSLLPWPSLAPPMFTLDCPCISNKYNSWGRAGESNCQKAKRLTQTTSHNLTFL